MNAAKKHEVDEDRANDEESLQKIIEEEKRLSKKIRDQIFEIQSLDNAIEEKRKMVEKVELLEFNNLTPKNITYLIKIIENISVDYSLSGSVALSRFIGEVKAHYHPILGFREVIKKLEKEISCLENKIDQQKKEFDFIQETNDLRKEALRAMRTINNLGISDAEIVNLKNFLIDNEYVLNGFLKEVNKLKRIDELVNKKTMIMNNLERDIQNLKETKKRADEEIIKTQKNLTKNTKEFYKTINDDIKKMKAHIKHLEKEYKDEDSSSIVTGLNILEETHNKLTDLLNKIEKTGMNQ